VPSFVYVAASLFFIVPHSADMVRVTLGLFEETLLFLCQLFSPSGNLTPNFDMVCKINATKGLSSPENYRL